MRYAYLLAAFGLALFFALLFWPETYVAKESFLLDFGEAVEDVSVLSPGFRHAYSFAMPTDAEAVCFEASNVTFILEDDIMAYEIPSLLSEERFCNSDTKIAVFLENRGEEVAVQKV
ncbi:hypothetical protein HY501_02835 [Candidatus Woesearchaeota archaeon]|nr:hypothetical protein [Candidatus Woesearchaeota archaeon]